MNLVTLDFETYFADDYTLSKMTTEAYVRDPRFKTHCVGMRLQGEFQLKPSMHVWDGENLEKNVHLSRNALLCHHAQFDGLILSHHYSIKPAFWFDTLSMARLLFPHGRHSLAALAERFNLPQKTVPYNLFKGVRDLAPDVYAQVAAGCAHDVELTHEIFRRMLPHVPKDEFKLIDLTIRMFTEPALRLDRAVLSRYLSETSEAKDDLLAQCGITREDCNSAKKFAGFLRALGVDPVLKISKKTKKETYAFAKTDKAMKDLLEHEDERVQALAAARLGIKSNMVETRAQRLLDMDTRGPLCVYLAYAKAQTLRWAGGDKLNWQNFKRGSPLRKALRAPEGYHLVVIDASQIEARLTDWFYGQWDMVEKWRAGVDQYSDLASQFYGEPVNKTMPDKRGLGKLIKLSCGYRAGAESIQNTARIGVYGPPVHLTLPEAKAVRDLYRSTHPKVKHGWEWCDREVLPALLTGEMRAAQCHPDTKPLQVENRRLLMPGNIWLDYSNLRQQGLNKWGKPNYVRVTKSGITHMHGGILTQNIMECLARQILSGTMLKLAEKGAKIVTCTHDEIVYLATVKGAPAALQYGLELLSTPPAWAPGLPLGAEGSHGEYYGK